MSSVSVCIVTYNSEHHITACIEALQLQSYPIDTIVIVDNASSDNSIQLVQEKRDEGTAIIVIENERNNGFSGGQNQAIEATDSDYVLVLNPDVVLERDYVKELVLVMENNQQCGSATGLLVRQADPTIVDSTGLEMKRNRHAVDRGSEQQTESWLQSTEVFGVSGAAALYRRAMIESIKLKSEFFDEHFFAYKEDVDVAWRARLLGWTSYYSSAAKAFHARGWQKGRRAHISLFVRQHSYQNQLFMLVKNEQLGWEMLSVLPVVITRELMKVIYIVICERDLMASWKQFFRLLPIMRYKRKLLKQKLSNKQIF